ncbi:MAG: ribosomal-protein-serine acetyltransferase [Glaciecola sp.]|jgi:ribosomal-protein-serine acetyltransferase
MEIKINNNLKLESVSLNDAEQTFRLIDNSRDYLREWLPWVDQIKSVDDVRKNIEAAILRNDLQEGLELGLKYNNKVIGRIGLHFIDKANNRTSIGYWLSPSCQGNGVMREAVKALCAYCFDELNMNRIEIACATGNTKSQSIPTRLGFIIEGTLRHKELLNGSYVDHNLYVLLKENS